MKDRSKKQPGSGAGQSERSLEIASRARLTASLREQRLKRDAELAANAPPAKPPRRRTKAAAAGAKLPAA